MSKIDQFLLKTIHYGVYLTLFIPLFVSKHFYYPFISTKLFLFRIIVEILFAIWLILLLRGVVKRPRFNLLVVSTLIFTAVFFLSGILGVGWHRSWWGTIERGSGIFSFLHYIAFFLIIISVFRKRRDWNRLFDIFLFFSLLVSLYALAQKLSLPLVYETGIDRATGTTGNAAHLASFLIFPFFISLGRLWQTGLKAGKKTYFYLACFIFSFLGIALSQTRGAIIGVVAGLFIFFLLLSFWHKNKSRRRLSLVLLILFFTSIGGIFMARDQAWVKNSMILSRLTNISLESTTAQQRLFSWGAGWQAFKERPLLGWGAENYNAAYNKYFNPGFYDIARSQTYFDKAHNIVIELLVTTGIIGLLAYFFWLAVFYYHLWLYHRLRPEALGLITALAGLIGAYFVQNLLVFDTVITYIAFFLLLGFVYQASQSEPTSEIKYRPWSFVGRIVVLVGILLSFYLISWHNIKPAIAAYYTREAMNEANKSSYYYADFSALMRRSLSYGTVWDAEYITYYTTFYKEIKEDAGIDKAAVAADVKYIIAKGEDCLLYSQQDSKFVSQLSGLYEIIYDFSGEKEALTRAEELIKEAIELSPKRIFYLHILAQIYEFNGRDREAIAVLEGAVDLNPRVPETYWALALMYSKINDPAETIKYVKKAIEYKIELKCLEDIETILPIFIQEEDYVALAFLYGQAVNRDPANIDYIAQLAGAYAAVGNNKEAIETAQKILNINPLAADQVNQFIADVEAGRYLKEVK